MSTTHSNDCPRTNDISTVTIKDRSPWKNHSLWWCCIYAVELQEKKRLLTLSLTVEFALMLASWANFLPYFNPSWSAIYLKKKIHGVKMLHVKFIKHLSNTDKHRPTYDTDKTIFVHRLTTRSSWTSVCRRGADHIKVVTASIIPSSQYLLSIFHIWTTFNISSWKVHKEMPLNIVDI